MERYFSPLSYINLKLPGVLDLILHWPAADWAGGDEWSSTSKVAMVFVDETTRCLIYFGLRIQIDYLFSN